MINTWIFGNGLDIGLNLKTRYSDFYEYMKENVSEDNIIRKKYIEDEANNQQMLWSDYEVRLGQITDNFDETQIAKFSHDKDQIDVALNNYLLQVNENIEISNEEIEQFHIKAFDSISNCKREIDREKISSLISLKTNSDFNIRYISFNYTDSVNRLSKIDKTLLEKLKIMNYPYSGHKTIMSAPFYVHGTVTNHEMVIGVNDESQIKNEIYASDNDVKETLIKKELLDIAGQNNLRKFSRIIETSDIICLYGVSIGETDSMYWEMIKNRLLQNNVLLIIYQFDSNFVEQTIHSSSEYNKTVLEKFYKSSKALKNEIESISDKIIIIINNYIFSKQ